MKKPSVVFFGNERLATGVSTTAPTLLALINAGYDVKAVVANNDNTISRNQRTLEVAEVAKEHAIPVLLPTKPSEIIPELAKYRPDIGVLAAYGKLVPQSVIDVFGYGIINIHPSLLPKHRGPIPVESVILNGETKTGVSIMQLVKDMDAGPVFGQTEIEVPADITKQALADQLLELGGVMVIELLPGILDGSVVALPQSDDAAAYDQLIAKGQATLDFTKPAEQLEREVRAFADWPKSRTTLANKEVVITAAHVADGSGQPGTIWRDGKSFGLYAADNILVIDGIKPSGKQEMSAEAFLAGYGKDLA